MDLNGAICIVCGFPCSSKNVSAFYATALNITPHHICNVMLCSNGEAKEFYENQMFE